MPLFPGHPPAKQPEQRRKEALETLRATHQHLAQVLRARKQQQAHEEKQMRRRTAVLAQERAAVAQAQIISQRLSGILEPARLRWARVLGMAGFARRARAAAAVIKACHT